MPTKSWFPTLIYCDTLQPRGVEALNKDLVRECHQLRDVDEEGRRWSKRNYPRGYTSYATINELHRFSSTFAGLEKKITGHVLTFAKALDMDLRGRRVWMTDFWVNIMPSSAGHPLHLHPLSFISGTYYVQTPKGCPGIKFEDPRLDRFMAAPPKLPGAKGANRCFATYAAEAGNVILFESWLRHEVPVNQTDEERISVSFNFAWA